MTLPNRRGGGGGGGETTLADSLPDLGDDPDLTYSHRSPKMALGWVDPSADTKFAGIEVFTSAPTKV